MYIQLGEWLPDLPDYINPGLTVAKNCIPDANFYSQFKSFQESSSNGLNARCQGADSFLGDDLTAYVIAGDSTKLYRLIAATNSYSDISIVSGYSTPIDATWYFAQISNRIIATNYANNIQSYVMGSSALFADLGGTPPKAKFVVNIRNFILLGFLNNLPYTCQWSDFNAPTTWSGGLANTATLESGSGAIMGIVGGEYGVLFRDKAIYRINYIGAPYVFEFVQVEKDRGCLASNSIVPFSNNIFYLGQDGFYIFDGNQSTNISNNKVSQFFFNNVNPSYFYRIKSCLDINNQNIITVYPDGQSTDGTPNRALIYNYQNNKWSYIETINLETIFISRSLGYTIDTMNQVSSTIDGLTYPFDSRFWAGGNLLVSGFSSNHKSGGFTGSALDATLATGEANIAQGVNRTVSPWIKPIYSGSGSVTVTIGSKNNTNDSVTNSGAVMMNNAGLCPVRINARYIRAQMDITGGFDKAQGFELVGVNPGAVQ